MDFEFNGSVPDGLVGWQDTHYKLTAAQVKAMGVRMEDVPPRVDANGEIPRCDFISTAIEDEKDFFFSTIDPIRFAAMGTERVYPPHGGAPSATTTAGIRIAEVDNTDEDDDLPGLEKGCDVDQADNSIQDDTWAENIQTAEPTRSTQSTASVADVVEDEAMHDVKVETIKQEVLIKEEIRVKQEEDMDVD